MTQPPRPPIVDRSGFSGPLEERLARTTSPRQRALLETVITHYVSEGAEDVAAVMDTLNADPIYRIWLDGRDVGPKGRAAVEAFYTPSPLVRGGTVILDSTVERVVVDDDTVVTELHIVQLVTAAAARAFGYDPTRDDALHVIEFRTLIIWPFDADGKLTGEDGYVTRDVSRIREADDADIPERLRERLSRDGKVTLS